MGFGVLGLKNSPPVPLSLKEREGASQIIDKKQYKYYRIFIKNYIIHIFYAAIPTGI